MRVFKVVIVIVISCLCGCVSNQKPEDTTLVWWVSSLFINENNWIKKGEVLKDKEYIENEYTKEFNNLLKKKGFDYKVAFRYMDTENLKVDIFDDSVHEYLKSNKKEQIDIFSKISNNYEDMADLTPYAKDNKVFKKFYESMPTSYWSTQMVDHKIKYVPKITLYGKQNALIYNNNMAQQSGININEIQDFKQLKEGMQKVFDDKKGSTIPFYHQDISDSDFYSNKYYQLSLNTSQYLRIVKEEDKWKIVNICESEEFKNMIQWNEEVNQSNLTGLQFKDEEVQEILKEGTFVYAGKYIPQELISNYDYYQGYTPVPFGLMQSNTVGGEAIYKNSNHIEKSSELLAMINMDKDLSELFIYGLKGKDYNIKSGIAYPLTKEEKMPTNVGIRAFTNIGNYLIITPSQQMGKDGQVKILEYINRIPVSDIDGFNPILTKEENLRLLNMYKDAPLPFRETKNSLNELEKANEIAKEKTHDILAKLQKQLDEYLIQ